MNIQRLLLVGAFLGLYVGEAFACSCMEISPSEAYKNADIIFVGSVTQFEAQGDPEVVAFDGRDVRAYRNGRKATFRIHKIWKGSQGETMSVFTGEGGGDCGFDFMVGHEYLVYASRHDGQLHTGICSRTRDVWFRKFTDADEDFKFLQGVKQ